MNQEQKEALREKDYEKGIERILTDCGPGESNLVALLSINLKLLIEKVYKEGWDDGFVARENASV